MVQPGRAAFVVLRHVFSLVQSSLRVEPLDLSIRMLIHTPNGYRVKTAAQPRSAAGSRPRHADEPRCAPRYGHVAFDVTDLDDAYDRAVARAGRSPSCRPARRQGKLRMAFLAGFEGNLVEHLTGRCL